jgi:hypothetical protein
MVVCEGSIVYVPTAMAGAAVVVMGFLPGKAIVED